MKVLLINLCARRMRSGAGLLGSLRSIHSQTRSRARFASSRELIVPAAFVLDVGGNGTQSLENFPALDDLLELDPAA